MRVILGSAMKAMVLRGTHDLFENDTPLELLEIPTPKPAEGEVLIRVLACGVCHTDMDEVEGRVVVSSFPIVLGHQVVGIVKKSGLGVRNFNVGDMVGVAWIGGACGECDYCGSGRENLCSDFIATGRDKDGGFAEFMVADAEFIHPISEEMDSVKTAPLLCAGAIGYRCVRLSGITNGDTVGLMGFGASAHLVIKLLRHSYPLSEVFVFARAEKERQFAMDLGASWSGGIEERSPKQLSAIIDTTPVWRPVLLSLENLVAGGRLVVNSISKEDSDIDSLLSLDYQSHLWLEKEIKSVANVTREDVAGFLSVAFTLGIEAEVTEYGLEEANSALLEIRRGGGKGAKVLKIADR